MNENIADLDRLDELFDTWTVFEPGTWENDIGPKDWWAVANDVGIIAYFGSEKDAFRFRFQEINRALNG